MADQCFLLRLLVFMYLKRQLTKFRFLSQLYSGALA